MRLLLIALTALSLSAISQAETMTVLDVPLDVYTANNRNESDNVAAYLRDQFGGYWGEEYDTKDTSRSHAEYWYQYKNGKKTGWYVITAHGEYDLFTP